MTYFELLNIRILASLIPEKSRILFFGNHAKATVDKIRPLQYRIMENSEVDRQQGSAFDHQTKNSIRNADIFDYIILSDTIGKLNDIQYVLKKLTVYTDSNSRIIISFSNMIWQSLIQMRNYRHTEKSISNLLTPRDVKNLLHLSGYEIVEEKSYILLPIFIPYISEFFNRYLSKIPLFHYLCFTNVIIARKIVQADGGNNLSVSIIVPCRNEAGTIEQAVRDIPEMGSHTEIILIDDHSTDDTRKEMLRIKRKYANRDVRLLVQSKDSGKAKAVHHGFRAAKGDILMILDGDLSVMPVDLVKFYDAINSGLCEFSMGSRLIYPLEKDSMRFLNIIANKFFSVIFSLLLSQHITDTLCGTKVFFKKDYEQMRNVFKTFDNLDPFGDFDLIFSASRLHRKILEIPVRYYPRQYGKSNIRRIRHGLKLIEMVTVAAKKITFRA